MARLEQGVRLHQAPFGPVVDGGKEILNLGLSIRYVDRLGLGFGHVLIFAIFEGVIRLLA
jgi:hypothetical protein